MTSLDSDLSQTEGLLILETALTASLAGFIRFVTDKLSWEAELEGYEEALAFFRRAQRSLADLDSQPDATAEQRETLIDELAAEALRENESWLLSHRERPLEPVIGG